MSLESWTTENGYNNSRFSLHLETLKDQLLLLVGVIANIGRGDNETGGERPRGLDTLLLYCIHHAACATHTCRMCGVIFGKHRIVDGSNSIQSLVRNRENRTCSQVAVRSCRQQLSSSARAGGLFSELPVYR